MGSVGFYWIVGAAPENTKWGALKNGSRELGSQRESGKGLVTKNVQSQPSLPRELPSTLASIGFTTAHVVVPILAKQLSKWPLRRDGTE